MTKSLIQQLAERAGLKLTDGRLCREDSQASLLLFELCAYLDEREKGKPGPLPEHVRRERRPPSPDELVGALHDPIHPPSGSLISASPVRVKKRDGAESQGEWRKCTKCRGSGIVPTSGEYLSDHCNECRGGMVWAEPPAAPEVTEPHRNRWAEEAARIACEPDITPPLRPAVARLPSWEDLLAGQRTSRREYAALEQQLAEARAELASRCDHAAIHELNRDLVEARERAARMDNAGELACRHWSEAEERLTKMTAERDELKSARDSAENLAARLAVEVDGMRGVVEAARAVVECVEKPGTPVSEWVALLASTLRPAVRAITAAAAKPPEP